MIGRLHRQSSLFYVAFHREASLIKDDLLEPLDALLEDEELIELVREALGRRRPQSRTRGRCGIAPDRLLRCCVLKQLKGWSLRELEREVRGSLVYRRFTRFDQDPIPNYSNFSRAFAALGEDITGQIHARAAKHRVLEIRRAAKSFTEGCQEQMKASYGKLVGLTRGVFRQAEQVCEQVLHGTLPVVGNVQRVLTHVHKLEHFAPLVKKVIDQTQARVFGGDTHVQGKILSLFEEHTQVIRKGKAHKPTEFGRLVQIDEVENGIVSHYEVKDGNPSDEQAWEPALAHHKAIFGHAPRMATADRGFSSASNERAARDMGVQQVALPVRGRRSSKRATIEKQRWFQRALRWRGGIEARIGTLKHRFGMARARFKGETGFKRYVGWSIIAHNLVSIARARVRRKARAPVPPAPRAAGSSRDARCS